MKKSNFVITTLKSAWIPDAKRLFAADPYIAHVLEREGRLSEYEDIQVARAPRMTREEFQRDHEFVDRKHSQYISILVRRLDELHGTSYGEYFWRKALSLAILRHVSLCYDLFQSCEANFNPVLHDCRVLDEDSYFIPVDFDDHRRIFQNTNFGQEQLFSVYCGLFYPGQFVPWHGNAPSPSPEPKSKGWWRRFTLRRVVRRLLHTLRRGASWLRRTMWARSPRVGIMDAYFSAEHMSRLMCESRGRIQNVPLPELPPSTTTPQWEVRKRLVCAEPNFDHFDKFVFACLLHGMPKIFVEDFQQIYARVNLYFDNYKSLRWVVCEAWIGHTLPSLALAILRQRGVKHIYNEHNYLSYFFVGSNLKYLVPLVDEFVTLGWEDPSMPNLVRGASLFQWVEKGKSCDKEHEILFVLGLPITHVPEINAAYGDSGAYRALSYFDMNQRFLAGLGEETLSKLYVRSYPSWKIRDWLTWDQSFALAAYLKKVKAYDDVTTSGRLLMQQSRLVVVNYLSTAYLESIIADIPTVFIWNKDTNLFTEKYMGVFDALIETGICQTNPEKAADFINRIKDNPEEWWHSTAVQKSRKAFLDENIGNPEVMIQYLLAKSS